MPETLRIDGKLNIHIISPIEPVLDSVADKILLPTPNGSILITPKRAPLFIQTCAGPAWIYNKNKKPECYYISFGFAEIRRDICSVLAWGIKADDIDKNQIHQKLIESENLLEQVHSSNEKLQIKHRIDFFKKLLDKPSLLIAPDFE